MRIDWDKYEVALLIETYLTTKDLAAIEKKECYAALSSQLRQKAINNGNVIDDRFRNLNGVAMRVANIQFLFTGKGLQAYSSLDAVMYEMYLYNPKEFNEVLREAKNMVGVNETGLFHNMFGSKQPNNDNANSVSAPTVPFDKATQSESVNDCIANNSSSENCGVQILDFTKPLILAYTKPISMSLFDNAYSVRSWQAVYLEFCNALIDYDPSGV